MPAAARATPLRALRDVADPNSAGGGSGAAAVGGAVSAPLRALARVARDVFVPRGRLPPDYAAFQVLDCVQGASSYLRGVLTLHATLRGAGLAAADGSDAPAAAVSAFILKEGASHVGSLLFAWRLGRAFDAEVKAYRLAADLANDVGLTIELLAPLAGAGWFLPLTCLANVAKALCGVAAGATRVAVSAHFAGAAGGAAAVGEMAAKEGAQETAVTLLGLALGLRLAGALNASLYVQAAAFAALTLVHVIANYAAVKVLQLRTLNRSRLAILLADRASTTSGGGGGGGGGCGGGGHSGGCVMRAAGGAAVGATRRRRGSTSGASATPVTANSNSSVPPRPPTATAWTPPSPADVAAAEPMLPLQYGSALDDATCGAYSAAAASAAAAVAALRDASIAAVAGMLPQRRRSVAADSASDAATRCPLPALLTEGMRLRLGCGADALRAAAAAAERDGGAVLLVSALATPGVDAAHAPPAFRAAQQAPLRGYSVHADLGAVDRALGALRSGADGFLIAAPSRPVAPSCGCARRRRSDVAVAFLHGVSPATRALAVCVAAAVASGGDGDGGERAVARGRAAVADFPDFWAAVHAAGYAGVVIEEGGERIAVDTLSA